MQHMHELECLSYGVRIVLQIKDSRSSLGWLVLYCYPLGRSIDFCSDPPLCWLGVNMNRTYEQVISMVTASTELHIAYPTLRNLSIEECTTMSNWFVAIPGRKQTATLNFRSRESDHKEIPQ